MILETQEDRDNEFRIISTLAEQWKSRAFKLEPPQKFVVDYAIHRDKEIKAIVEVKARQYEKAKWETLLISAHKIMHGRSFSGFLGVPFMVVIEWTDGTYYRTISPDEKLPTRLAGRSDRGIDGDIEPCVMIPIDDRWKPA